MLKEITIGNENVLKNVYDLCISNKISKIQYFEVNRQGTQVYSKIINKKRVNQYFTIENNQIMYYTCKKYQIANISSIAGISDNIKYSVIYNDILTITLYL